MPEIRRLAQPLGLDPRVRPFRRPGLIIDPREVVHTSHPAFGYVIDAGICRAAWAPEFWRFPDWASDVDLLFAEAAGWNRPIRFAKGVGGHAAALDVSREAEARGVRRLVFAHIGRPTIRALDKDEALPFGEAGQDGAVYELDSS